MTATKNVTTRAQEPKEAIPRRPTEVGTPYFTLEKCVEIAGIIYNKGGGSCSRSQLASMLNMAIDGGSFITRVTASKAYGLIEQEGDQLRVTDRGRAIVAPVLPADADRARLDAFLNVPLFKRVYEEYNGQSLPPETGLRNLLAARYGVAPGRVIPTVSILLESAQEAGLFKVAGNRSRMVAPLPAATTATPTAAVVTAPPAIAQGVVPAAIVGTQGDIPAGIIGLLQGLPPAGTVWSKKKRDALIAAFTKAVEWIYPDREDVDETESGRSMK